MIIAFCLKYCIISKFLYTSKTAFMWTYIFLFGNYGHPLWCCFIRHFHVHSKFVWGHKGSTSVDRSLVLAQWLGWRLGIQGSWVQASLPAELLHQGLIQPAILPRSAKWVPACWDDRVIRVSCVGVATRPGLCPIAKETASTAPTLCTEYGPNGWMDLRYTYLQNWIIGCHFLCCFNVQAFPK